MWVALTGTPGVGKSTVAAALAARGLHVVAVADLARDWGLLGPADDARSGTLVVDEEALAERFAAQPAPAGVAFVEGHFAHELPVDAVVLLRASPAVLIERLEARDWPEAKVRENVEAEALDVIAGDIDASGVPVAELDVTADTVEVVVDRILAIVENPSRGFKSHAVGSVAWSLESVPWF